MSLEAFILMVGIACSSAGFWMMRDASMILEECTSLLGETKKREVAIKSMLEGEKKA